jgi:hypothetical protein
MTTAQVASNRPSRRNVFGFIVVRGKRTPNGEHEPREAAATGSRMRRDRAGCLPLAQCSGWAGSSDSPELRWNARIYAVLYVSVDNIHNSSIRSVLNRHQNVVLPNILEHNKPSL